MTESEIEDGEVDTDTEYVQQDAHEGNKSKSSNLVELEQSESDKERRRKSKIRHQSKKRRLRDGDEGYQSKRSRRSDQSDPDEDLSYFPIEESRSNKRQNSNFFEEAFDITNMSRTVLKKMKSSRMRDFDTPSGDDDSTNLGSPGDDYGEMLRHYSNVGNKQRKSDKSRGSYRGNKPLSRRREPKLCRFFQEGFCRQGEDCTFSHDCVPRSEKTVDLCRYYQNSVCAKGDECTFLHGQFPCKYYHMGSNCYSGNNCKFSHKPMTAQLKEAFEKVYPPRRPVLLPTPPNHEHEESQNYYDEQENFIESNHVANKTSPSDQNGYNMQDENGECNEELTVEEYRPVPPPGNHFNQQRPYAGGRPGFPQSPRNSYYPPRNRFPNPPIPPFAHVPIGGVPPGNQFIQPPPIMPPPESMPFPGNQVPHGQPGFPPTNQFRPPIHGSVPIGPPPHVYPPMPAVPLQRIPFVRLPNQVPDMSIQQPEQEPAPDENNPAQRDSTAERDPRDPRYKAETSQSVNQGTTNANARPRLKIEMPTLTPSTSNNSAPTTPGSPQIRQCRNIPLETDTSDLHLTIDPRRSKQHLDGSVYTQSRLYPMSISGTLLPSLPGIQPPDGPLIKCNTLAIWKPLIDIDLKVVVNSSQMEPPLLKPPIDSRPVAIPTVLNDLLPKSEPQASPKTSDSSVYLPDITAQLELGNNTVSTSSEDSSDEKQNLKKRSLKSISLSQYKNRRSNPDFDPSQSSPDDRQTNSSNEEPIQVDFSTTSSIKDLFKQVDPTASPFL